MPRGSKIGERRGGRDRGTPNRRTVLVDRILSIAAERPTTLPEEFVKVLAEDQNLPTDLRMAIARSASQSRAANSSTNKQRKDNLAGVKSPNTAKQASLKMLFGIVLDTTVAADQRRKAALETTNYLLPKKPGMERWWINAPLDEYRFVITPTIAAEYRDTKFELRRLSRSGSNRPRTKNKIEKLRARIKTILHRLQCPCPSLYGKDQLSADRKALIYFLQQRENRTLSAEENAAEAHRRARVDSFDEGPESASRERLRVLEDKERKVRKDGPGLTHKEGIDLQFLRVLYSHPRLYHDRCSDEVSRCNDHPLRDEPLAEDGNLYPPNPKLRLLDNVEFAELADLLRHCYPPQARMPPLKDDDVIYVDSKGFRWSKKLLG